MSSSAGRGVASEATIIAKRLGGNNVPEVIGGTLCALAGVAVLVIRYRRRDRLIAFMPLVPIGFGLVAAGVMLTLGVSLGWIAAVVVGSIIIASRRVPLVLFWTGRISRQQAALLYAAVLPVAVLVVSSVTGGGFWSWPLLLAAALLFLVSYGTALGIFGVLKVAAPQQPERSRTR